MMALVSELSMNQANALKLQQNLKEKEADLEQCYIRMEKGEAPSDEIQAEWFKILRDEDLSLIHISEPTRPLYISYAVFCLKKVVEL